MGGLQLVGCHEMRRMDTELSSLAKAYDQMRQDLTADFRCVCVCLCVRAWNCSDVLLTDTIYPILHTC